MPRAAVAPDVLAAWQPHFPTSSGQAAQHEEFGKKGILFVSIRSIAGKFNLPCLKQKKCSRKPEARHGLMRAFYGDVRE